MNKVIVLISILFFSLSISATSHSPQKGSAQDELIFIDITTIPSAPRPRSIIPDHLLARYNSAMDELSINLLQDGFVNVKVKGNDGQVLEQVSVDSYQISSVTISFFHPAGEYIIEIESEHYKGSGRFIVNEEI